MNDNFKIRSHSNYRPIDLPHAPLDYHKAYRMIFGADYTPEPIVKGRTVIEDEDAQHPPPQFVQQFMETDSLSLDDLCARFNTPETEMLTHARWEFDGKQMVRTI